MKSKKLKKQDSRSLGFKGETIKHIKHFLFLKPQSYLFPQPPVPFFNSSLLTLPSFHSPIFSSVLSPQTSVLSFHSSLKHLFSIDISISFIIKMSRIYTKLYKLDLNNLIFSLLILLFLIYSTLN